jgi:glycerophosphoryl diester phosphodiesterase
MSWPYRRIISHRGGGILAPENTLSAMAIAKLYGVNAVEFDVM